MAATTWHVIRNDMITQLETGTTPASQPATRFRVHNAERLFLDRVEAEPASSFRLFDIGDFEDDDSGAALNDTRVIDGTFTVSVAYPENYQYGEANFRDMARVMREDYFSIDNSIGLKSHSAISNVSVLEPFKTEFDLEGVRVMELTYRAVYCRAS